MSTTTQPTARRRPKPAAPSGDRAAQKTARAPKKPLDANASHPVSSDQPVEPPAPPAPAPATPAGESKNMAEQTLELKQKPGARKSDRLVIFDYVDADRPGSVQFLRSAFGDTIPDTIKITAEFGPPKTKLTPEERKAQRKNMTPEQKIAELEAKTARLREKLAGKAA